MNDESDQSLTQQKHKILLYLCSVCDIFVQAAQLVRNYVLKMQCV